MATRYNYTLFTVLVRSRKGGCTCPHGFSINIASSFKLFTIKGPYVHSFSLFLYCLVSSGLVTLATVHGGRKVVLIISVWCGEAGNCRCGYVTMSHVGVP